MAFRTFIVSSSIDLCSRCIFFENKTKIIACVYIHSEACCWCLVLCIQTNSEEIYVLFSLIRHRMWLECKVCCVCFSFRRLAENIPLCFEIRSEQRWVIIALFKIKFIYYIYIFNVVCRNLFYQLTRMFWDENF